MCFSYILYFALLLSFLLLIHQHISGTYNHGFLWSLSFSISLIPGEILTTLTVMSVESLWFLLPLQYDISIMRKDHSASETVSDSISSYKTTFVIWNKLLKFYISIFSTETWYLCVFINWWPRQFFNKLLPFSGMWPSLYSQHQLNTPDFLSYPSSACVSCRPTYLTFSEVLLQFRSKYFHSSQ